MSAGTDFLKGRVVRGECAYCRAPDVLLYAAGDALVCASDMRAYAAANPTKQACDSCGSTGNVWRDPVHRRNEYLCINCHDPAALFQNRWANKVRESKPLGIHPKAVCHLRGYGTDCKGEVKPRGQFQGKLACNKHAGKTGVGPNG